MKSETEIRNLRRELKEARAQLKLDSNRLATEASVLRRRVHELEVECAATKRDNERLEEIAALSRRLAEAKL